MSKKVVIVIGMRPWLRGLLRFGVFGAALALIVLKVSPSSWTLCVCRGEGEK